MSRITVLGSGAWGTAIALSLYRRGGHQVALWAHSPELAQQIAVAQQICGDLVTPLLLPVVVAPLLLPVIVAPLLLPVVVVPPPQLVVVALPLPQLLLGKGGHGPGGQHGVVHAGT